MGCGLTPLKRYNWCILQPQSTGPDSIDGGGSGGGGGVLPLCRDAVSVFYCCGTGPGSIGGVGSYPFAEIQLVYSTAPVN